MVVMMVVVIFFYYKSDNMHDNCLCLISTLDGRIRLVDGDSPLRGRLEVHYQGVWGTVCGDNWRSVNSDIVCQQLGYQSADPSLAHYRVLQKELQVQSC